MNFTDEEKAMWESSAAEIYGLQDGFHTGKLANAFFEEVDSGRKRLCLVYSVFEGRKSYIHNFFIENPKQIFFCKKALEILGVDPSTPLDEIEAAIRARIGLEVHFELTRNGKYQNCQLLQAGDPPAKNEETPF